MSHKRGGGGRNSKPHTAPWCKWRLSVLYVSNWRVEEKSCIFGVGHEALFNVSLGRFGVSGLLFSSALVE